MSDTYSTTTEATPGVTVNVAAPQPAQASIPAASEAQVDAFLGSTVHPTGAGHAVTEPGHYTQDPAGGGFITGVLKGGSQQVLGALSLLPGIGNFFTRESWLGQRAYAPSRRGSESIGETVGSIAPWILGGEALASARGISALTKISPSLSRVLAGAERLPGTTAAERGAATAATEAGATSSRIYSGTPGSVGRWLLPSLLFDSQSYLARPDSLRTHYPRAD